RWRTGTETNDLVLSRRQRIAFRRRQPGDRVSLGKMVSPAHYLERQVDRHVRQWPPRRKDTRPQPGDPRQQGTLHASATGPLRTDRDLSRRSPVWQGAAAPRGRECLAALS